MSDTSKELEDAIAVVRGMSGRLDRMKRRPLDVQDMEPLKTRAEAEAFLRENPTAAHWRILDFIYGKAE